MCWFFLKILVGNVIFVIVNIVSELIDILKIYMIILLDLFGSND